MAKKIKAGYRRYRDQFRNWYRLTRANSKRDKIDAKIIAITGSSAKSTTTLLLMHILQGVAQVRAVALSNDLISAATGILALRRNDDYLIVESGAGIPGKLARMAKVLSPDVAIVTLVALEHKSEFRSIDAVMREKSEIVAAVRSGGFAVLNADDAFVMQMVSYTSQRIVKFGMRENADYQAVDIKARFPERLSLIMRYGQSSLPLSTNFVGEQFWLPAIAAAATSIELGVPEQVIVERISTFGPVLVDVI